MQVTHLEDLETSAVVGGEAVRAFGISDSAEFITMVVGYSVFQQETGCCS